ncbi:MAG: hypothetical protein E7594_07315 [Ruminococcaceae bacterium]|nr:hypothetical protein [Oscillospiraceae bacterium]
MDKNQNRKIPLKRAEYIKSEQRLLLSQGALLLALTVIVVACSAFWTVITIFAYTEIPPIFLVLFIGIAVALWIYAGYMAYTAMTANLPLFCLLTGKYTIEIDRVQRIELRSEKNRTYARSLAARMNRPDYVTKQYVDFEKYGQVKLERETEIAQNEQYYVLVALTKSPKIIDFRSCEKYEITGA